MTLFLTIFALGYMAFLAALLGWLIRNSPPARPSSRAARPPSDPIAAARPRPAPLPSAANDTPIIGWIVQDRAVTGTVPDPRPDTRGPAA